MKQVFRLLKCTYHNRTRQVFIATAIFVGVLLLGNIVNGFKAIIEARFWISVINGLILFILVAALLYGFFTQYKDYLVATQLGFSRTIFWWVKVIEVVSITLLIAIFGVVNLHVQHGNTRILMLLISSSIVVSCFVVTATFFALSSFLALFKRLGKAVMLVIIYLLMYGLFKVVNSLPVITKVIQQVLSLNLYVSFYVGCVSWIALMFVISYGCTRLMQVRRD